jgi:hypothetical protein
MSFEFDAPEELSHGGGNWIDKPGTYHLVVTAVDEEPISKKKELIPGFKVDFQAMEGTVRSGDGKFTEKDKTIDLVFFNPKITDKNEGLFARQKQAAFFIATGLMTEEQLGKSGIKIDLEQARGRHVIATLEEDTSEQGKKFIRLSYDNIWHIDDPRAASFPKNEKALTLIPSAHRRDPKSFKIGGDNGDQAKQSKPKDPPAAGNGVDLDDL